MFRRRRRQRGVEAVFAKMDEIEAYSWQWRQAADNAGEEVASSKYSLMRVVEIVDQLLPLCSNDPGYLITALKAWSDSRSEDAQDEERHDHVQGLFLSIGVNGIGNLFGFVPAEAPGFDPSLAKAGRERGWRR